MRFFIFENVPLCTVRFHIDVKMDGKAYATDFFDVGALRKKYAFLFSSSILGTSWTSNPSLIKFFSSLKLSVM